MILFAVPPFRLLRRGHPVTVNRRPVRRISPIATASSRNNGASANDTSADGVHDTNLPRFQAHTEHDAAKKASADPAFFDDHTYPPHVLEWCIIGSSGQNNSSQDARGLNPSWCDSTVTQTRKQESSLISPRVEKYFVDTFRRSAPYIDTHRDAVFVIHIPGTAREEPLFASIMEDIALMRVIGVKLVLVTGVEMQVDSRLMQENKESKFVDGIRITDEATLQIVKEQAGSIRFEIENALSRGVKNMPSRRNVSVVSGSFFTARPVGVIDGEDFGFAGKVRRIDADAITKRLDQGDIVLIPNVASSPSGQFFNCMSQEVAAECAIALQAGKLMFMGNEETLYDLTNSRTISSMTLESAARFMQARSHDLPYSLDLSLRSSIEALENGVPRAHIVNRKVDGALLMEVFHRDGAGLMVFRDLYEGFRRAKLADITGLQEIIRPLEIAGILKRRTKKTIEQTIDDFMIIELDGMIIACASLSVMKGDETWAEVGCFAVHREYRRHGKGSALLEYTEREARTMKVENLCILSTQSFDWFREQGFEEVDVSSLPESRREMYDHSRNSKIFLKKLKQSSTVSFR